MAPKAEYTDMTDEEYDALDEYYTKNPPKVSGDGKSGFFAKHAEKGSTLVFIDDLSATWLRVKAASPPLTGGCQSMHHRSTG